MVNLLNNKELPRLPNAATLCSTPFRLAGDAHATIPEMSRFDHIWAWSRDLDVLRWDGF